tara:strand:+ start:91 stop:1128 length:1038 start_codon:yes stop_codon:yes gene_type:complete
MNSYKSSIIVTGAAGFIGAALVKRLLDSNIDVIGIDNLNSYYNLNLKRDRLKDIEKFKKGKNCNWNFYENSITDKNDLEKIFEKYNPDIVVNLAAQAGVRYSITNPEEYVQTNLVGFANILETCRKFKIKHLVYASSSSVYGGNKNLPFSETQSVDHPVSLYAATKKSNEIMAHSYSHLFNIPCTGLRFFTVYGPWGRPDMAPMIFAKSIINQKPIKVFNYGKMQRDFTYIDDIVESIFHCCFKKADIDKDFDFLNPNPATSFAPHKIFNIGNNQPIELMEFIKTLEDCLNLKAKINFMPMQDGDVIATAANTDSLKEWVGFSPSTTLKTGIKKFAKWFLEYKEY